MPRAGKAAATAAAATVKSLPNSEPERPYLRNGNKTFSALDRRGAAERIVDLFKIACGKTCSTPYRAPSRARRGLSRWPCNERVRACTRGFWEAAGAWVSATWRPKHPPCRRRRCCSPPRSPFFFHGSIRMLSGLNWFVALCVCCLCVSCRAFVSCVSDGWRRIILRRRSSPADGGRARRLGGTQIHRYYHHQPLLCPIIQTSSVPKPCRATPRRKPLFHHLCT